jgi:hypothetical protein
MNSKDLEVRGAITSIWTIECQGKEFLYKLHKVQRFYGHYCKEKVEKWKDNGKRIRDELSKATMELQQDHLNKEAQMRLEESKEALKLIEHIKTQGLQVRVKLRWQNKGNTMSPKFSALSKRNHKPPQFRNVGVGGWDLGYQL